MARLAAEFYTAVLAVLIMDCGHGESEGKRYTFGYHERYDVVSG